MDGMQHHSVRCDGKPFSPVGINLTGSWIGHVLPGWLIIFWGLHWLAAILRSYLTADRPGSYRAKAVHQVIGTPQHWPIEPSLKIAITLLGISGELWWGHPTWRYMTCEEEGPRQGHFDVGHLNDWQHAAMYQFLLLSGVVDLLALRMDLPHGCQATFLGVSFLNQALLMGLHTKPDPLDALCHKLLTLLFLAVAVFVFMEMAFPRSLVVSLFRVVSMLALGQWLLVIAHIIYGNPKPDIGRFSFVDQPRFPQWQTAEPSDMTPVMFLPIVFSWNLMGSCLLVLAAYCGAKTLHDRRHGHARLHQSQASGSIQLIPGPVRRPSKDDCEPLLVDIKRS